VFAPVRACVFMFQKSKDFNTTEAMQTSCMNVTTLHQPSTQTGAVKINNLFNRKTQSYNNCQQPVKTEIASGSQPVKTEIASGSGETTLNNTQMVTGIY
jgi:hypothetical protein